MISVVMPAFNAGLYIQESIESVIAQTFTNWELIVVDDESVDDTARIVKAFAESDSRIRYFWQKNGKQGSARNRAIKESSGEYLAFIDADDVWLPNRLESQLRLFYEESADLILSQAYLIQGNEKTTITIGGKAGYFKGIDACKLLMNQNDIVISSVLVKREALFKVGLFSIDLRFQYCEDWHLWLNLALAGYNFFTCKESLVYYRIHEMSAASIERDEKVKIFYAFLDLYYRYPDVSWLRNEVRRKAVLLVYHNTTLKKGLVKSILKIFYNDNNILTNLLIGIYLYNEALFRKVFIYSNSKFLVQKNLNTSIA